MKEIDDYFKRENVKMKYFYGSFQTSIIYNLDDVCKT